jgi:tetratricopeptide (TPR) repeat protein
MMFVLGEKLEYSLLSDKLMEIAEKHKQIYKAQIEKLVDKNITDKEPEVAEAITKLVASSWWEVELSVEKTQDLDEKEKLYLAGIKRFPESHELLSNYALFLHDIRKAYDRAEKYYKRALEAVPDDAIYNGNYARFLENIRKDYEGAEKHYKKSLEAEPDRVITNGNYAGLLLARGRTAEAKPFLERAEKYADSKSLQLEFHFYRLAHFPKTADASRKAITDLLEQGVRSTGWDFSQNIEQAEKEGCTYVDELREIAKRISEVG